MAQPKEKLVAFSVKTASLPTIQSFDRQWHFWSVNQPPHRLPTVQVSSIVGISSIYLSTATGKGSSLMLIMAMASHGQRVSLLSCCLCGGGD
jgi:hypothetical protein